MQLIKNNNKTYKKYSNTEILKNKIFNLISEYIYQYNNAPQLRESLHNYISNYPASYFNEWENEIISFKYPDHRYIKFISFTLIEAKNKQLFIESSEGFFLSEIVLNKLKNNSNISLFNFDISPDSFQSFKLYINKLNPFQYQSFIANLLESHSLYTFFNSDPGKDAGVDFIASYDKFLIKPPIIKVQVKHWKRNKITVKILRELSGLTNLPFSKGMLFTSGEFTKDALYEYRFSLTESLSIFDLVSTHKLWLQTLSNSKNFNIHNHSEFEVHNGN